jgi:cell division topological specificity factor
MSLFGFLNRRGSAPIARNRLQILLAHERADAGQSDLVATLHKEILDVITKHIVVDRDKVQVKLDRGEAFSTLEIDIEMPPPDKLIRATAARPAVT